MKANEVMIGDWVEPNQCKVPTTYTRVEMIMTDGVHMEEAERQFDFEELHPIHVTKEILEANGFIKSGYMCRCVYNLADFDNHAQLDYNLKFSTFEIKRMKNRGWTAKLYIEAQYVHELQHALRLAGLSDLADNFVIEKGGQQ